MKRIRKFNESVSQIDYDYVYSCFAELIDDNKAEIELNLKGFRRAEANMLKCHT
jgi:hypothetical protein